MQYLGEKELKSYRIKTGLSGGQKVIASLLLTFAAIRSDGSLSFMILDEPFAHLDQERINVAGDFLRQTGVQFFVAMPYTENVKLFMPWVDMQINFMIEPLRDGCQVMWECDAKFGGMIAKVGNRVMGVIAKFLAENFFKGLQKQLHARV